MFGNFNHIKERYLIIEGIIALGRQAFEPDFYNNFTYINENNLLNV